MLAPARTPKRPLVLHGCEPDPGSRLVRERLCTLGIPYIQKQRPASGPLPHLEDPNTGFATFGAAQVLRYLNDQYRLGKARDLLASVPADNLAHDTRPSWISRILKPDR